MLAASGAIAGVLSERAWVGLVAAPIGALALIGAIFVSAWVVAPYTQRNEARRELKALANAAHPQAPHNRDALVRAIINFQHALLDLSLSWRIERFLVQEAGDYYHPVVKKAATTREAAEATYRAARQALATEERIAGPRFQERLELFRLAWNTQYDKMRTVDVYIDTETFRESANELLQWLDAGEPTQQEAHSPPRT